MKPEEFPSILERAALSMCRDNLAWHIEHWDDGQSVAQPSSQVVSIGPGIEWRPVNFDLADEDLPPGRLSLGHDPELIVEHLKTQAMLHNAAVNMAVMDWTDIWLHPSRLRPRLAGDADSYFWLRLLSASRVIESILTGQKLPADPALRNRPDLTDSPSTLQWLLITLWEAFGEAYLQAYATRARTDMRFKIDQGGD